MKRLPELIAEKLYQLPYKVCQKAREICHTWGGVAYLVSYVRNIANHGGGSIRLWNFHLQKLQYPIRLRERWMKPNAEGKPKYVKMAQPESRTQLRVYANCSSPAAPVQQS